MVLVTGVRTAIGGLDWLPLYASAVRNPCGRAGYAMPGTMCAVMVLFIDPRIQPDGVILEAQRTIRAAHALPQVGSKSVLAVAW